MAPTILVVEDDDDCRAVLRDLLELSGYDVRTCPNAHEAIEAARAQVPALMLVDFWMPDHSGAWVVETLREAGIDVPVVVTTASVEGRATAEKLGLPSLEKPFDVARLLELVRSLVLPA